MPCDLGYKSWGTITYPAIQPEDFKEEVKPPEADQDLLDKIGEDDPKFVEWFNELDVKPLLEEALNRAKSKVNLGPTNAYVFINEVNRLMVRGKFISPEEKRRLKEVAEKLGGQFQMEVLKIIAEILDYQTVMKQVTVNGKTIVVIEGEKETNTGVNKYLKITKDSDGKGELMFEHFDSKESLAEDQQKFLALAQKMGVKITLRDTGSRGQPIPHGTEHRHFLKEGE